MNSLETVAEVQFFFNDLFDREGTGDQYFGKCERTLSLGHEMEDIVLWLDDKRFIIGPNEDVVLATLQNIEKLVDDSEGYRMIVRGCVTKVLHEKHFNELARARTTELTAQDKTYLMSRRIVMDVARNLISDSSI